MTPPTLFSQRRFVDAIVKAKVDAFDLCDVGHGMVGVEHRTRFGLRHVYLGPFGLYASPDPMTAANVRDVVALARSPRTIRWRWNVRFDHTEVAINLEGLGLRTLTTSTHVLDVPARHELAFANFSTTRRRQVRRSADAGVRVRMTKDVADARRYFAVHERLNEQKDRKLDYPLRLFENLVDVPEVFLLLAELEDDVIGGGVFCRDGNSLMYWHGANDRTREHAYPMCAIFDTAIRIACEDGIATVNFGASLGKPTLEEFKESWGAAPRTCWRFEWQNPVWAMAARARSLSRRARRVLRERLAVTR